MAKRRSLHGTGQAALAAAGAVAELPAVPDLASEPPLGALATILGQPPSESAWTMEPASAASAPERVTVVAAEPAPPEAERAPTIERTLDPPAKSKSVRQARREVTAARAASRPAESPAATSGAARRRGSGIPAAANPAWLSGAFYEEMVSFADTRLRHVLAAGEALGRCKLPAEILAAQADYARTAFQDYVAQSLRLMGLATGLMDNKARARAA